MAVSRVSSYQLSKALGSQLNNTQAKFNKLTQQIASGTKLTSMADDPLAASSLIKVNKQLGDIDIYKSNLNTFGIELSQIDNTLKAVSDELSKGYDLSMELANGTMGADELKAYQAQLDSIIDNVTRLANTNYNGQYIFSGTRTTTIPYQESEDGLIYKGNDEGRYALIGDNKTQKINYIGKEVFGEAVYIDDGTGNKVLDPAKTTGAIGALYQLRDAIKDPENFDYEGVRSAMGKIGTSIDTVTATKTRAGAINKNFDDMLDSYTNDETNFIQLRSNLQDTDLPSAISNWYSVYQSMQASYSMMSQSMGMSLLDFI